ncbi:MAG TPA: GNAT family N-acetyltransferase [Planctomycetota bacterium]|nr:GNAT family N-acetyltransferase [Planctomycetota bacterium]
MILRDLAIGDLPSAAAVLGNGLRDNPMHVRVFGGDADARERALTRLFEGALHRIAEKGFIEGAYVDGRLAGICGRMPPGRCRIGFGETLRFLPSMLSAHPISTVFRIFSWAKAWGNEDPETPHWHLGPVGVLRTHQGQGIGSALLSAFGARMDQARSPAYLETDKDVNVTFYERAGFGVLQRKEALGVPCWFMSRPPGSPA